MQRTSTRRPGGLGRAEVPPLNEAVTIPRALSERVIQLIQGIRPGRASEQRRHGIAEYVRRLIVKCFQPEHKVEAFMFGSVPLRTYLPDGDIDVSIFCEAKGLQDTWCDKLSAVLESEAENPDAEFKVANVSLINAEVKLLKCLVDNIVVDVSFNQIGGLCTLNFLEAVDRKIGGKHLFKKSIILIKAWCYYESRVLGAQHSLLSTYALETMVLHIFNVYHSELQTPLEVLYKFLIVFHHFQWDDYCLTLSGPVSLKDLDINAVPLPSEHGKTLLLPTFMNVMLESYSYTPVVPANSKGPGYPKYMNIMDPLLHSNNLGRSVSKTSEIRIRNAFGHGARLLNQLFKKDSAEALEALDQFFKNTWLAQQRPRISPQPPVTRTQNPQPTSYPPPGMKSGHELLELLKESHKEASEGHEQRENLHGLYGMAGFHGAQANGNTAMQTGGNLGAIFPPPPPRGPDEKVAPQGTTAFRGADLERFARQVHPAQHIRNLLEMQQPMKSDSAFSAFAQQQLDPSHLPHAYQQPMYSHYPAMKFIPQQNGAHLARGRSEMGLQRTRSEPNIGDLYPKKKDKNAVKRYQAPFHVQHPEPMPVASQPPADEEAKAKLREGTPQRPLGTTDPKPPEVFHKNVAVRNPEKPVAPSSRPDLKLKDDVVEKLKVMEGRFKAAELDKTPSPADSEKESSSKFSNDLHKEAETKEDTASPAKTKPVVEPSSKPLAVRGEVHEQSIVIGEPPEPATVEYPRPDRDFFSASRSMIRRPGRPFEFHHAMHPADVRTSFIQLAHGANQRQPINRVGMGDRQMQAVMEMGPNGELLPSYTPVYPCIVNTAQFAQGPLYNILSAQGDMASGQMPPPRATGVPTTGTRHPGLPKPDGRNALVDLFPSHYQQFQLFRPEGTSVDRRMNGVAPSTLTPGWSTAYSAVNGAGPPRGREELAVRDSDDVLSGDIETLTQHLEVARNFVGCKTPAPSSEKDRSSHSSSTGHTPERNVLNAGLRKGSPSPTMSSRQDSRASSRERHPRSQMESPSTFSHHPHVPSAAPVGFPSNFPAQTPNVMYPVPPGYVAHPPPPPGIVPERMQHEGDLLAQLHANVALTPPPGYNYQGAVRGVHLPMAAMNVGNTGGHPPGAMTHTMMDPNLQLPPQPPRSGSPSRSKDTLMSRSIRAFGTSHLTTEDVVPPIYISTEDGKTVEVDASVFQAVRAAIAEKPPDEHGSRDPNNRTSQGDPNSPRHVSEDVGHLRGGAQHEPLPMHHLTHRRQLEEGVVCYTGPKEFPPFPHNRPPPVEPNGGPVGGSLAHFFAVSSAPSVPEPPVQPRSEHSVSHKGGRCESGVAVAGTGSYGTGSFIPLNSYFAAEQRRAREQAEKEAQAQGNEGNGEECSWSTRSGSNGSEKAEQAETRTHPRGRFSPSSTQQWSNSTGSSRSYTQTPPRSYTQADNARSMPNGGGNETWQLKQDRSMANAGDLSMYYKEYGELANAFVSTEAMTRGPAAHGGNYISYPNVSGFPANHGHGDYPSSNSFHLQSLPQRHGPHMPGPNIPRNRRDGDRWIPHPRNDKSSTDRSPTPDSLNSHGLIRRGVESSERWEGKRLMRNPNLPMPHRPLEPLLKSGREGSSDDDGGHAGRSNLENLFGPPRQPPYRGQIPVRHHRNRRPSPGDDRARFPLKEADFPTLESVRAAKGPSTPSSSPETPKGSDKQHPAPSR